jgi:hypothetical protein
MPAGSRGAYGKFADAVEIARRALALEPRPTCETPGCGRQIPIGGEGSPEMCPKCIADELALEPEGLNENQRL